MGRVLQFVVVVLPQGVANLSTRNSTSYQKVLEVNMKTSIKKRKLNRKRVIDKGPKYTSKSTKKWLRIFQWRVMEYPSQMNLIDMLWKTWREPYKITGNNTQLKAWRNGKNKQLYALKRLYLPKDAIPGTKCKYVFTYPHRDLSPWRPIPTEMYAHRGKASIVLCWINDFEIRISLFLLDYITSIKTFKKTIHICLNILRKIHFLKAYF